MTERIGIIVGWEDSFPAGLHRQGQRDPGLPGGAREDRRHPGALRPPQYRRAHRPHQPRGAVLPVPPQGRALAGTYVINDPFWWSADDKFFGFSLAAKIGVDGAAHGDAARSSSYIPAIDPQRSLRNLEYPLDWEAHRRVRGLPRDPQAGGRRRLEERHAASTTCDELMRAYDDERQLVMTLQQFIDFDEYVRCICIGKEFILPIQYDPKRRCYLETRRLPAARRSRQKVLDGAWALNHALGYDMNSVEFAIKDGVPYAIDFTNPAPDMDIHSILPKHFHMVRRGDGEVRDQGRARGPQEPRRATRSAQYLEKPVPRPAGCASRRADAAAKTLAAGFAVAKRDWTRSAGAIVPCWTDSSRSGVEEEYQIVDPETRELRSYVSQMLGGRQDASCASGCARRCTSRWSRSAPASARTSTQVRSRADRAARRARPAGAQGRPAHRRRRRPTRSATGRRRRSPTTSRYHGIVEDLQDVARANLIFGLHVHVGIKDKEVAIALAEPGPLLPAAPAGAHLQLAVLDGPQDGPDEHPLRRSSSASRAPASPTTFESYEQFENFVEPARQDRLHRQREEDLVGRARPPHLRHGRDPHLRHAHQHRGHAWRSSRSIQALMAQALPDVPPQHRLAHLLAQLIEENKWRARALRHRRAS